MILSEIQLLFLLAGITFMGAMLFGSLPLVFRLHSSSKILGGMTGMAAGFLIGAALLVIIPEGYAILIEMTSVNHQHSDHELMGTFFQGSLAILAGFVLMLLLEAFGFGHDLHEEHHDHSHTHGHEHVNHPKGRSTPVIIGLTIHAFTDGMVIAAALSQQAVIVTFQLAIGIMMHKMPAAFSVTAFSLHERHNPKRAKWDLLLFSCVTPLAIFISWVVLKDLDPIWSAYAILFSAGTFLYVATVDALPQIHNSTYAKPITLAVCAGVCLMFLVTLGLSKFGVGTHLH